MIDREVSRSIQFSFRFENRMISCFREKVSNYQKYWSLLRGGFSSLSTILRADGVEMISPVVLGLFTPILKLDNRLSRSSWRSFFAVCPENILHGRKTRDMLLLAHFVGDGVSVTRLVCRLVCKISGGIRFSGKKRSCMVTFQANVRVTYESSMYESNIDKRKKYFTISRTFWNFILINNKNKF